MNESREPHPLRSWMDAKGLDYDGMARLLPSHPKGESIRQIASGYRPPSWDLAFEIEAVAGISAHDLRDPKWYPKRSRAA